MYVRFVRRLACCADGSALPRRIAAKRPRDRMDPLPMLMRISQMRFSVCIRLMRNGAAPGSQLISLQWSGQLSELGFQLGQTDCVNVTDEEAAGFDAKRCITRMRVGHLEAYALAHECAGWWLTNPVGNPGGASLVRSHKGAGAQHMTQPVRQVATSAWAYPGSH